jgi:hypothetical protein
LKHGEHGVKLSRYRRNKGLCCSPKDILILDLKLLISPCSPCLRVIELPILGLVYRQEYPVSADIFVIIIITLLVSRTFGCQRGSITCFSEYFPERAFQFLQWTFRP